MKNSKLLLGLAFTGMIVAAGCASTNHSADSMAMGECHGVNSCKGQGDCGGKGYSCAGKNSCKGHGWVKLSQNDCQAKGGKFKAGAM